MDERGWDSTGCRGERGDAARGVDRRLLTAGLGLAAGILLSGLNRQLRPPDMSVRAPVPPAYPVDDEQFLRSLTSVLPPRVVGGNRVTTLVNGDEIFPAMLAAIRGARRTVTMETFIYWRGRIAQAFSEALAERARAGVRCHVLLDWFGSKRMDPSALERMRRAGVEVVRYHRRWWHFARANHRTHRKLLVVDGTTGFTGGVGVADEWTGDAQDACHWRDNHYRVEGPVVAQLQSAFTDNWLKARHVVLHDKDYFPPLSPAGDLRCQAFQSSPDEGSESMRLMFLMGLAAARKSVRIATAYFVPDRVAIDALVQTRRRGVEVDVIVPGPNIDFQVVRHASRHRWHELVRNGVRVFEYMPTMFHWKAMVVDDLWSSIGSTNFDSRSFRINDEANLNIYDRGFALEQVRYFERDLGRCRPVTLARLEGRSPQLTLLDMGASTLESQL